MIPPALSRTADPQPLIADAIRSGLKTRAFGQTLYIYDRVESTNTAALALADAGAPEGTVVLAESQTKGRGRMGRRWISPPDVNLHLSIVLRPGGDPRCIGLWVLSAAVAVARVIHQTTALPARLKWPNDVLIHHKKVAGLLLESAIHKRRFKHVVLGIGVNVNLLCDTLPGPLQASVTSLRKELGRVVNRIVLIQRLLENLELEYRLFQTGPPRRIQDAYTALSETLGQTVTVLARDHQWTGRAAGLSSGGALILQGAGRHERVVRSEDVIHLSVNDAARD